MEDWSFGTKEEIEEIKQGIAIEEAINEEEHENN